MCMYVCVCVCMYVCMYACMYAPWIKRVSLREAYIITFLLSKFHANVHLCIFKAHEMHVHTCMRRTCIHAWDAHAYMHETHVHTCMRRTCIHAWDARAYMHETHVHTCMRRTCIHAWDACINTYNIIYTHTHIYTSIHIHTHKCTCTNGRATLYGSSNRIRSQCGEYMYVKQQERVCVGKYMMLHKTVSCVMLHLCNISMLHYVILLYHYDT
jgi:hypothetical protein